MTRTLEQTIRANRIKDRFFFTGVYTFYILFCLAIIYPFFFIFINSINGQLYLGTAMYWPESLTFSNYGMVFSDTTILHSLMNSAIRVVLGSTISVFLNSMCAFGLRKRNLKFRAIYLIIFTIPMFFQGGLIPHYLNLKMLGFLDKFIVYLFPRLYSLFYIIILMSCFNDVPDSIEESAHIDGAGHFQIYRRIYLPMSVPVIATIYLFVGVMHLENWMDTLYFTRNIRLQTFSAFLMMLVRKFSSLTVDETNIDEDSYLRLSNLQGTRFAGMIVAIVPVLVVYPFVQKYFVKGLRLGAIKG